MRVGSASLLPTSTHTSLAPISIPPAFGRSCDSPSWYRTGIAFLIFFLMSHTTFVFSDVLRTGALVKHFPKREAFAITNDPNRSEEHTSELQSHSELVCRLLLEKK